MKHTAKNFKDKLETTWYGLTSKEQKQWAGQYAKFCWYTENIFKNFPDASISFDADSLYFNYETGEARLCIEPHHTDILLPAIEEICAKYGKQLTNLNPYFLPLTA